MQLPSLSESIQFVKKSDYSSQPSKSTLSFFEDGIRKDPAALMV